MLRTIQDDFEKSEKSLKIQIREKEGTIDNLKRELDYMKFERNESHNQMQNLLQDNSKNKFALFNTRAIKKLNSHQNSMSSVSTMNTFQEDKDKVFEKINNEKAFLEKQLVEFKFKFAETAAKLNELEGEYDRVRRKCDVYL